MPGIFAAGAVRHGSVKRVASGVGEGSVAISFIVVAEDHGPAGRFFLTSPPTEGSKLTYQTSPRCLA